VKDASASVVVCAQAFHWFANARALDEIARALAPKGRLGLIWNMRDARVPWVAQLDAIVNRYEGEAPRYYTGAWRQAFPHARFGALNDSHFTGAHSGSPEAVIVQRVRSTSFIAALAEAEWRKVEQEVRQLIAATPELRGRAQISVPYETAAYWTERLA
jgi:SAM-dependent methyltransferase